MDIFLTFYGILSFLAICCLIIMIFLSGDAAYGLQLAGYFMLFIALIPLTMYFYYNTTSTMNIIGVIFYMLTLCGTIIFKLYSLFAYKNRIISNGNYYSYFNKPLIGLIILQIFIIIGYFSQSGDSSFILSVLCLIGLFNFISAILDFNVLTYFYADGFCSGCHR
jgi:hypothetical protein